MDGTYVQHYSRAYISSHADSAQNTLPASWYSSNEMYEFERRAIFSKQWLFISHKSRLAQTGDWIRYAFAGYDIIITRDRTATINAFHNVCRHRAYPVIEKEGGGNNKILACRYHGWSYGLNGKLAKAPGYQEMNLDKERNSLFRCHVKVDRNGFLWINLDAEDNPSVVFEEHLAEVDALSNINLNDYTFDSELEKEDLNFNWKFGLADSTPEQIKNSFSTTSTCYFPYSSTTISSKFAAIQKVFPQAPSKTARHIEIYRHKDCSDKEWETVSEAYADTVIAEAQGTASASFQTHFRDAVADHYTQEKTAGREIWPSRPIHSESADQADEDEEICAGLACGSQKEVLAW